MNTRLIPGTMLGLAALAVIPGLSCRWLAAEQPPRRKYVYQIPAGFRGWVKVEYSSPTCSALEDRDGHRVVDIGADGTACTRHSRAEGWTNAEVRYQRDQAIAEAPKGTGACCQPAVLPKGVDPEAVFVWWGMGWTCRKIEIRTFFVGTIDEYNKSRGDWQKFSCGDVS